MHKFDLLILMRFSQMFVVACLVQPSHTHLTSGSHLLISVGTFRSDPCPLRVYEQNGRHDDASCHPWCHVTDDGPHSY